MCCGAIKGASIAPNTGLIERGVLLLLLLLLALPRDDAAARRLTLLWVANNSMSLDLCASIAFREQWLVFGVEGAACYGGEAPSQQSAVAA
jgi:hypothetical protein